MTDWKEIWKEISAKFDKMSNISLTKTYDKCLIVAHGDLDGIVSATLMKYVFKNRLKVVEVIYTRPHYIKIFNPNATKPENRGIKTDIYDLIIVVDIAVNNRDPQSTINFINSVRHKLLWIDHHETTVDLPTCIIRKKDSCVKLITDLFPDAKYPKKVKELIKNAHDTDMGNGDNIYNHSLKINLRSDEARREIDMYGTSLLGGELETLMLDRITIKSNRHNDLIKHSNEVYDTLRSIHGNITVLDIREYRNKTIDSTYLFHKCYKDTPVVIFKYLSTNKSEGGEEYLKIARSRDYYLNLPRLFGLKSGAKYRITIPNSRNMTKEEKENPDLVKGREIYRLIERNGKKIRIRVEGKCMYRNSEIFNKLENGLKYTKSK